ncbi:MAG: Gfo/Idh/MocA family protein, partial [Halanaerobiales bacterium]
MQVCIIGSTGHTGYVVDGIEIDGEARIAGIAPGSEGEDVKGLFNTIKSKLDQKPVVFNDYRKMLDTVKPDVAVVASYFKDHAPITLEVLKRDIHVFVEKPIATTFRDLNRIKEAYRKTDVNMAAMFGLRYTPWFLTTYHLVKNGVIGRVRLMNAQKSYKLGTRGEHYKKREIYGGTIPWVGSHAIDWIQWYSNEKFKSVYASHSSRYNKDHGELEMTGLVHFEMTDGVFAGVNIDYLRPETASTHGDDRIRIAGTEGVLEVREGKVFLINDTQEGIQEVSLDYSGQVFADFLKEVRDEGTCLISAEDAIYVT